ncbi:UDP-N-acetylmuramate--L-alanine ligase [bioreactor metagenome]|uniref:UDP-N-acetylmuramate--L-alanine ligase n=1 Tax=bioreactor metagenome TaxID=1076179 RepID=A0A644W1P7_9ZZZZ
MNVKDLHIVYFLGIGGIGMSALARYMNMNGVKVSGYDKTATALTQALEAEGIQIHYNADTNLIPANADLVVYTPAVPADFEEWEYIRHANIPVIKRSAMLAEIINNLKSIAVAGTHGKTTVSAMIAHVMESLTQPFLGFVGGVLCQYNKNIFIHPDAQWAVAEADEYDRSFLALRPFISIINAIDADHLDIYGKVESLHESFSEFASQTSDEGSVLVFDGLEKEKLTLPANTVLYGFSNNKGYSARNIHVSDSQFVFDVFIDDTLLESGIRLPAAGRHNIQNAIAAFSALHILGFDAKEIAAALETYPGVKRRLELIAQNSRLIYYDDYAHHPAEINALINTIRELYPGKTITGIFQPHLFSRTRDFGDEFGKSLSGLDFPVVTDIYPAREKPIHGIDAKWLLDKIQNEAKQYVPYAEIPDMAYRCADGILLTIGAGDIDVHIGTLKTRIEQS